MLIVYFLREFIVLTIYNEAFLSMTLLFKWQLLADFMRFIANVMSFKFLAKKQISYFIYTQLLGLLLYHVLGHHLIETYKTEGVVMGLFVSNLIYLGSVMTVLRHDLFGKNRPM
jgi:PST family polysaccharide transporter